jgi:hypothetical protein
VQVVNHDSEKSATVIYDSIGQEDRLSLSTVNKCCTLIASIVNSEVELTGESALNADKVAALVSLTFISYNTITPINLTIL